MHVCVSIFHPWKIRARLKPTRPLGVPAHSKAYMYYSTCAHVHAHLLPYSLAVTMPSTSCVASCRLLLGLYCNLRINSPPDALLHLELRIYTVVTEFALLELGLKIQQLRTERCIEFRLSDINKLKNKRKNVTLVTQAAWLDCSCLQYQKKKKVSHACDSSRSA